MKINSGGDYNYNIPENYIYQNKYRINYKS